MVSKVTLLVSVNFFVSSSIFFVTQTGGTIDVTIHEMLEDGRVRELYKATGGPWGGDKVNEAFIEYLCDIL